MKLARLTGLITLILLSLDMKSLAEGIVPLVGSYALGLYSTGVYVTMVGCLLTIIIGRDLADVI
jgi:hypothetical protein